MKMKLRLIAFASALIISFSACGGSGTKQETEPSKESTTATESVEAEKAGGETITFWMQRYGSNPSNQEALMDAMTKKFHEETGYNVEVVYIDWAQALTKYTLASTGGEAPDVGDLFFLQSLVQMGGDQYGPMEINDLAAEIGMDNYYEGILHEVKVGEDYYGIPWRADTRVMAYNQDMFDEAGIAGPPKTWDELVEIGKKLTTYDSNGNVERAGMAWNTFEARFDQTWFTVIAQAGGQVFSDDLSAPAFNSPEGIESLQFMQDLVYKHNISPEKVIDPSYNPSNEMMAGQVAMMAGAQAEFMVSLEANAPQMKDKIKAAVLPSKTGQGASSIAFAAPISIFKNTEHPEAAKAWVKFFTSPENQLECSKKLSLLNANKTVMNDPYFTDDPWLSVFTEQFERTQMGDMPLPQWSQIDAWPDGPIPLLTTEVMAGKPVKEAVEKAEQSIKNILK